MSKSKPNTELERRSNPNPRSDNCAKKLIGFHPPIFDDIGNRARLRTKKGKGSIPVSKTAVIYYYMIKGGYPLPKNFDIKRMPDFVREAWEEMQNKKDPDSIFDKDLANILDKE